MSNCRFGVSPVNYPDPDPDPGNERTPVNSKGTVGSCAWKYPYDKSCGT